MVFFIYKKLSELQMMGGFRKRFLFDNSAASKLQRSGGTTEQEAMTFATEPDHRGIRSLERMQSALAVRGSVSLCVATGLGLMTTGVASSLNHYALLLVAHTHLRCYRNPSFSASFFQKTPEVSKLCYACKYLLS